jgi:aminopeptidase C
MSNKKMNELYTVSFLGNVVGGGIIKYANLEIEELKKATIKSIKNNEAVWFGCDVGKMFNRDLGIMDMELYNYNYNHNHDSDEETEYRTFIFSIKFGLKQLFNREQQRRFLLIKQMFC